MLRISNASVLERALIVNTNARVKPIHVVDMLLRIQVTDRVGLSCWTEKVESIALKFVPDTAKRFQEVSSVVEPLVLLRQPRDHLLCVCIWRENRIPDLDNLAIFDSECKSFDELFALPVERG
jgi:hypothetical protein